LGELNFSIWKLAINFVVGECTYGFWFQYVFRSVCCFAAILKLFYYSLKKISKRAFTNEQVSSLAC